MTVKEQAHNMKLASALFAATKADLRNSALENIKKSLEREKEAIFEANKKDLKNAEDNNISQAIVKRLKFDEKKLKDTLEGIDHLISLPDPIGKIFFERELDTDLVLKKVSCPIGVIGVIFEARPDALVQISSLCIKSGNCAILKGGKETANTNSALFEVIKKAAIEAGLPENCLFQAESHAEIDELLKCDKDVDLLIPRGSNAFVRHIMDNTKIPVMGHADGICHIYIDKEADFEKTLKVVRDAKTQYTAACNAVETLLVNRQTAKDILPLLAENLKDVAINGTKEVCSFIKAAPMDDEDFRREYLNLEISVKIVEDIDEAIEHINKFGSHHTDAIITENIQSAEYFMDRVDSAGVYLNCSTRFADGFRYGFGAEVGISTSKIHARGPVGLDGLMTYKYKLYGKGQIVADYAEGRSSFKFKDISK
ncbi:MAG: glutamate-5-semialdehyde dehydrogenase [Firmicutes bacterium]|nr:glutamate-5-semialdehyde dehydrogenase [Bacillota bacterium]